MFMNIDRALPDLVAFSEILVFLFFVQGNLPPVVATQATFALMFGNR